MLNQELTTYCLDVSGLLGTVAPCVLYGSNVERLAAGQGTFANSCLPYTGLYLLGNSLFGWNCLAPWFSHPTRTAIRQRYNLEASVLCTQLFVRFSFVSMWVSISVWNLYMVVIELRLAYLHQFVLIFEFISIFILYLCLLLGLALALCQSKVWHGSLNPSLFRVALRLSPGNVGAAAIWSRTRRGVST
jgi:hypothetical protein